VRLLCFCDDHDKAVSIAEKVNDKPSSYHLARTLEDKGDWERAMEFYSKAEAYGSAIRICKENGWDEQLWGLALKATVAEQIDAAKYFETKEPDPEYDKAVQLYSKAGYVSKALDLAFS